MNILLNLQQVREEAGRLRDFRLAVLAPGDLEVIKAVKEAKDRGLIHPVLLGNKERIVRAAERIRFDLKDVEIISVEGRMNAAVLGLNMFYTGEVDIVMKGQIPTSYIYRAVINKEKEMGESSRIAVSSLWELGSHNRFILLTDTGININPDWQAKMDALKKAVLIMGLLGYTDLKALILTAAREIEGDLPSKSDGEEIKKRAREEKLPCKILLSSQGGLRKYLGGDPEGIPDIILVPHLDAGNIIVKLDFFLDIQRSSVVMSSRGPVVIPSRSDTAEHILDEIALGKVISSRLKDFVSEGKNLYPGGRVAHEHF